MSFLQFVIYRSVKNYVHKIFAQQRNRWCWKSAIRTLLEICCQTIWCLFAGFKNIFLWSAHSLWFMKFVFSAKIWFMKTSTWIVKYKSRVIKSNPAVLLLLTTPIKTCNFCWGRYELNETAVYLDALNHLKMAF